MSKVTVDAIKNDSTQNFEIGTNIAPIIGSLYSKLHNYIPSGMDGIINVCNFLNPNFGPLVNQKIPPE